MREMLEIGAAFGLSLGVIFGALVLWKVIKGRRMAEERLQRAYAVFMDHLAERFDRWRLTPAEADVAIFAIKGLHIREIAELRQTSEGTVKAQTNAIYRKAGVSGRSQFLSLFIEDLMEHGEMAETLRENVPRAA
jgi:DNA-binding NarL/FixJ family response regulator